MKVKVVSGYSLPRQITLTSKKFSVTAKYTARGITTHVEKLVSGSEKRARFLYWPLPQIVRWTLYLLAGLTLRLAIINLVTFAVVLVLIAGVKSLLPASESSSFANQASQNTGVAMAPLVLIFLYLKLFVAKWHGAEHMAAHASWKVSNPTYEDMVSQNHVSDQCGNRALLPMILLGALLQWMPGPEWLYAVLGIEGLLWIEYLDLWGKIPVLKHATYWFQRVFTTAPPGERELLTAYAALTALRQAHKA